MERTPIDSSVIASVGYDADTATLEIEFVRGRVYQFLDVPASMVAWFMRVPDKGAYFNRKIRDHYSYRDITPPDDTTPLMEQLMRSLRQQESAEGERDPDGTPPPDRRP